MMIELSSSRGMCIITLLVVGAVVGTLAFTGKDLISAAKLGREDFVRITLVMNPEIDINWMDSDGRTALHYAAGLDYTDVVLLLLAHGAGINFKDSTGHTPISIAAFKGHPGMIKLLAIAGADPNIQNKWGATPVMAAILAGQPSAVEALLAAGANIAVVDDNHDTALHWAVTHNNSEIALMLLQAGAATGAQNVLGQTPAQSARAKGNEDIADLIDHYTTTTAPTKTPITTTTTYDEVTYGSAQQCGVSLFLIIICLIMNYSFDRTQAHS